MSVTISQPGPRYAALLQLLRTAESLWNASRMFFDRWDLSPSQFNVLNVLHGEPEGCTQTDLSRQLIMHRSNVTGLVDRLEERGLVRRADSTTDRRAWRVVLTSAGEKLMEEILPEYYRVAEEIWGSIPAKQATRLAAELAVLSQQADHLANARQI